MIEPGFPRTACRQQLLIAFRGGEHIGRHRLHAVGEGKLLCPLAHQQHVRALLHHQTGGQHRVAQMADPGHGARFQGNAVHHAGIQLVGFVAGKHRANPGVKQRALLQQAYRFGDHIQRAFSRLQHSLAGFHNR